MPGLCLVLKLRCRDLSGQVSASQVRLGGEALVFWQGRVFPYSGRARVLGGATVIVCVLYMCAVPQNISK